MLDYQMLYFSLTFLAQAPLGYAAAFSQLSRSLRRRHRKVGPMSCCCWTPWQRTEMDWIPCWFRIFSGQLTRLTRYPPLNNPDGTCPICKRFTHWPFKHSVVSIRIGWILLTRTMGMTWNDITSAVILSSRTHRTQETLSPDVITFNTAIRSCDLLLHSLWLCLSTTLQKHIWSINLP